MEHAPLLNYKVTLFSIFLFYISVNGKNLFLITAKKSVILQPILLLLLSSMFYFYNRRIRLAVRTRPSQGRDRGSIPLCATRINITALIFRLFYN